MQLTLPSAWHDINIDEIENVVATLRELYTKQHLYLSKLKTLPRNESTFSIIQKLIHRESTTSDLHGLGVQTCYVVLESFDCESLISVANAEFIRNLWTILLTSRDYSYCLDILQSVVRANKSLRGIILTEGRHVCEKYISTNIKPAEVITSSKSDKKESLVKSANFNGIARFGVSLFETTVDDVKSSDLTEFLFIIRCLLLRFDVTPVSNFRFDKLYDLYRYTSTEVIQDIDVTSALTCSTWQRYFWVTQELSHIFRVEHNISQRQKYIDAIVNKNIITSFSAIFSRLFNYTVEKSVSKQCLESISEAPSECESAKMPPDERTDIGGSENIEITGDAEGNVNEVKIGNLSVSLTGNEQDGSQVFVGVLDVNIDISNDTKPESTLPNEVASIISSRLALLSSPTVCRWLTSHLKFLSQCALDSELHTLIKRSLDQCNFFEVLSEHFLGNFEELLSKTGPCEALYCTVQLFQRLSLFSSGSNSVAELPFETVQVVELLVTLLLQLLNSFVERFVLLHTSEDFDRMSDEFFAQTMTMRDNLNLLSKTFSIFAPMLIYVDAIAELLLLSVNQCLKTISRFIHSDHYDSMALLAEIVVTLLHYEKLGSDSIHLNCNSANISYSYLRDCAKIHPKLHYLLIQPDFDKNNWKEKELSAREESELIIITKLVADEKLKTESKADRLQNAIRFDVSRFFHEFTSFPLEFLDKIGKGFRPEQESMSTNIINKKFDFTTREMELLYSHLLLFGLRNNANSKIRENLSAIVESLTHSFKESIIALPAVSSLMSQSYMHSIKCERRGEKRSWYKSQLALRIIKLIVNYNNVAMTLDQVTGSSDAARRTSASTSTTNDGGMKKSLSNTNIQQLMANSDSSTSSFVTPHGVSMLSVPVMSYLQQAIIDVLIVSPYLVDYHSPIFRPCLEILVLLCQNDGSSIRRCAIKHMGKIMHVLERSTNGDVDASFLSLSLLEACQEFVCRIDDEGEEFVVANILKSLSRVQWPLVQVVACKVLGSIGPNHPGLVHRGISRLETENLLYNLLKTFTNKESCRESVTNGEGGNVSHSHVKRHSNSKLSLSGFNCDGNSKLSSKFVNNYNFLFHIIRACTVCVKEINLKPRWVNRPYFQPWSCYGKGLLYRPLFNDSIVLEVMQLFSNGQTITDELGALQMDLNSMKHLDYGLYVVPIFSQTLSLATALMYACMEGVLTNAHGKGRIHVETRGAYSNLKDELMFSMLPYLSRALDLITHKLSRAPFALPPSENETRANMLGFPSLAVLTQPNDTQASRDSLANATTSNADSNNRDSTNNIHNNSRNSNNSQSKGSALESPNNSNNNNNNTNTSDPSRPRASSIESRHSSNGGGGDLVAEYSAYRTKSLMHEGANLFFKDGFDGDEEDEEGTEAANNDDGTRRRRRGFVISNLIGSAVKRVKNRRESIVAGRKSNGGKKSASEKKTGQVSPANAIAALKAAISEPPPSLHLKWAAEGQYHNSAIEQLSERTVDAIFAFLCLEEMFPLSTYLRNIAVFNRVPIIASVSSAISRFPKNPIIVKRGLEVFKCFAVNQVELSSLAMHAAPSMLAAMELLGGEVECQCIFCAIVTAMGNSDDFARENVIRFGIHKPLLTIMQGDNLEAAVQACIALSALSQTEENAALLSLGNNFVEVIFRFMTNKPNEKRAQIEGIRALHALARSPEEAVNIFEHATHTLLYRKSKKFIRDLIRSDRLQPEYSRDDIEALLNMYGNKGEKCTIS